MVNATRYLVGMPARNIDYACLGRLYLARIRNTLSGECSDWIIIHDALHHPTRNSRSLLGLGYLK